MAITLFHEQTEGALGFYESLAEQVQNLAQSYDSYKAIPVIAKTTYLPSFKFNVSVTGSGSSINSFKIVRVNDLEKTTLTAGLVVESPANTYYYNAKTVINTTLVPYEYYYAEIEIQETDLGTLTLYSDIFKVLDENLTQFELWQDSDEADYFKFWKETELYYNDSYQNIISVNSEGSKLTVQRSVWDVRGFKFGVNQSDINITSKFDKYRYMQVTDRFGRLWVADPENEIEKSLEPISDSEYYTCSVKFKANKVVTSPALDVDSSNATIRMNNSASIGSQTFPVDFYFIQNAKITQPEFEESANRTGGVKIAKSQYSYTRKMLQGWLNRADAEKLTTYFSMCDSNQYKDAGGSFANILDYEIDECKMTEIDGNDIVQIDITWRVSQISNFPLA